MLRRLVGEGGGSTSSFHASRRKKYERHEAKAYGIAPKARVSDVTDENLKHRDISSDDRARDEKTIYCSSVLEVPLRISGHSLAEDIKLISSTT